MRWGTWGCSSRPTAAGSLEMGVTSALVVLRVGFAPVLWMVAHCAGELSFGGSTFLSCVSYLAIVSKWGTPK